MAELIFNRDEELAQWAEARMPDRPPHDRPLHAIGVSIRGELAAVAIYNNWSDAEPYDMQIHLVSSTPRWATQGTIRALLHYPFEQIKVRRLTAVTSKRNKRLRRFVEGIGFRLEGVHRYRFDGRQAACTYAMYREDAMKRWLHG